MEPILDLKAALSFLSLGGAAVAVQVLVNILLEKSVQFQALSPTARFVITVTLAAVLGVGSTAILTLTPPETLQTLQPYFAALVLSVSPLIGGEIAHRFLKKPPVTVTTVASVAPASTVTTISSDTPSVVPK